MDNFFYNITGILVGFILFFLSVTNFKNNRLLQGILIIIHALLFVGTGIGGFFVPDDYAVITIFVLLGLCITLVFTILVGKTNDKTNIKKLKK